DIGVDAVKIGMLGDVATITAVREALDLLDAETPVVLDPVMVAESGAELLAPDARDALVSELLPRVTVVTPNVPEARVLAGAPRAHRRAAAPRRRLPRVRLHPLLDARGALGTRRLAARGGAGRAGGDGRRRGPWAARHRARRRAGGRAAPVRVSARPLA